MALIHYGCFENEEVITIWVNENTFYFAFQNKKKILFLNTQLPHNISGSSSKKILFIFLRWIAGIVTQSKNNHFSSSSHGLVCGNERRIFSLSIRDLISEILEYHGSVPVFADNKLKEEKLKKGLQLHKF